MEEKSPVIVSTSKAPAAIGPYSQAIRWGDLVFLSGQIGMEPATGELVEGGVTGQARRALQNLQAVLEEAGSGLDRCLKVTVYMADMADYPAVNEIYAEFFSGSKPARAAIAALGLPKGALVEIDAVAAVL
jgi:2-iminobutanoate/2-iminopropanoate deaminase